MLSRSFCRKAKRGRHVRLDEERSHSGLVRRLGKAVYPQGYRGFKSPPLRQIKMTYRKIGHFYLETKENRTSLPVVDSDSKPGDLTSQTLTLCVTSG